MMSDPENVAQRLTDALLSYTAKEISLDELISEIVASVAELDARTAHVQR